ncbi:MAG: C40 family peptidase [Spirochaetales bacterium]|nr:C40 family peptidase [Spirochaetales bacterium]
MSILKNCNFSSLLLTGILLFTLTTAVSAIDVEKDVLDRAESCLGITYSYGGVSRSGFDCSGFVYYIYKDLISDWPRVAREQARRGVAVDKNALAPGDITFWATGRDPNKISHVSIYMGNDSMIHALSEGPRIGINISSMKSRYWVPKYLFSRRIFTRPSQNQGENSGNNVAANNSGATERVFARGKYIGQLSGNRPHGKGTYQLNNGDVYEGEFRNGLYHGKGKYSARDGNIWEGTFVSGKLHGSGTRIWPSGSIYEGNYEDGLESGGWFTSAESGKVNWILRNRTGEWEIFSDNSQGQRVTDTAAAPPFSEDEDESINYIFGENPWDSWEGFVDIPDDWETGPLFEESYQEEQDAFQNSQSWEKDAFERFKATN